MSERNLKRYRHALKKTSKQNEIAIIKSMLEMILKLPFKNRLKFAFQILFHKKKKD